ncbi:hypothetical protein SMICM304S_07146 [Streptomyces microflavus]
MRGGAARAGGRAIIVKGGIQDASTYPTTQPWTGLQAPFHCATAPYWDNIRLCNVHASWLGINPDHPTWDYRDDQFAEIKAVVDQFPRTVFGGDFNAKSPDAPNNAHAWVWPQGLYSQGPGTEGYQECDQTGTSRAGPRDARFRGEDRLHLQQRGPGAGAPSRTRCTRTTT